MAFKTVLCTSESQRRTPDIYLIYKVISLSVVGIWGDASLCKAVMKSLEAGFPQQYDVARAWASLDADGGLQVCFDKMLLHIPEFYLQEFERALRLRLEAAVNPPRFFAKHRDAGAGFAPEGARECAGVLDRVSDQQGAYPASEARQNEV